MKYLDLNKPTYSTRKRQRQWDTVLGIVSGLAWGFVALLVAYMLTGCQATPTSPEAEPAYCITESGRVRETLEGKVTYLSIGKTNRARAYRDSVGALYIDQKPAYDVTLCK